MADKSNNNIFFDDDEDDFQSIPTKKWKTQKNKKINLNSRDSILKSKTNKLSLNSKQKKVTPKHKKGRKEDFKNMLDEWEEW